MGICLFLVTVTNIHHICFREVFQSAHAGLVFQQSRIRRTDTVKPEMEWIRCKVGSVAAEANVNWPWKHAEASD